MASQGLPLMSMELAKRVRDHGDADAVPADAKVRLDRGMARTAVDTARLRSKLRRSSPGHVPDVYVAPSVDDLVPRMAPAFDPATQATGVSAGFMEQVTSTDLNVVAFRTIVQRTLLAALAQRNDCEGAVEAALDAVVASTAADGGAEERREGLWAEFRRHVNISPDRLWIFVRTLSGVLGGDVNEIITMADEAAIKATRALQDQRVQIAKRVSDMQAKIVETIVSSMVRDSKLTVDMSKDASQQLVVVDSAARERLSELRSGESGRPFFEANVAIRNLQEKEASETPPTLQELLQSVADVGGQLQASLEVSLTQKGTASASLVELSHPSNSYFVNMRADATAAVRVAHERMNVELGARGASRPLALWEVVEGGCTILITRFAEFVGHVLVQARSATGVSAMYVGAVALHTNAIQARVALERLIHVAVPYCARVNRPNFEHTGTAAAVSFDDIFKEQQKMRVVAIDQGEAVEASDLGRMWAHAAQGWSAGQARPNPMLPAPIPSSRWFKVGGVRT